MDDQPWEQAMDLLRAWRAGGAGQAQWRSKNWSQEENADRLKDFLGSEQGRTWRRRLWINDEVELALLHSEGGLGGVHLGQEDLEAIGGPTRLRELSARLPIGLSTHNEEQFREAQEFPLSYVALGPILTTRSKQDAEPALGIERFRELLVHKRLPLVVIGGLGLETSAELLAAGANAVAGISLFGGSGGAVGAATSAVQEIERLASL